MLRHDGRTPTQMRPIRITPNFTKNALSSCLVEYGNTMVLCTCSMDKGVPKFLKNSNPPQGWLTAEYSMLPGSSESRIRRERPAPSGRSQEIQRLIGRTLRGIVDTEMMPDVTLQIDCDVLQADGGTRTASITGAYVALGIAMKKLIKKRVVIKNPISGGVAAVSVGLKGEDILVDLDYKEDSTADLDMNVVLMNDGKILELQGTAENATFDREQVMGIIDRATDALNPVFEKLEQAIAEEEIIEF